MKSMKDPYYNEEEAVAQVGKGWETLVRQVYAARESLGASVRFVNVKEKLGGLRMYTDDYHKQLEEVIKEVGYKSLETCDQCGQSGKLLNKEGWYLTRCEEHSEGGIVVEGWPLTNGL